MEGKKGEERGTSRLPLVPTRYVGMWSRRAAPLVMTNVLRIRDAARPELRSHAARGNESMTVIYSQYVSGEII